MRPILKLVPPAPLPSNWLDVFEVVKVQYRASLAKILRDSLRVVTINGKVVS